MDNLKSEILQGCDRMGCSDVGTRNMLKNRMITRVDDIHARPWRISQQTGSCGFTSILMAMFYLYKPEGLLPLFKTVFGPGIVTRLWKRYTTFFMDKVDHTHVLDYFLTVGMMLVFKDKGTKFELKSANPHHQKMWKDCIEYSKPFCNWELNPYNAKLKDLMARKVSVNKDRLSFKKGDLALCFSGLIYEADAWMKQDIVQMESIHSPEPPPVTPFPGITQVCEIVGVGPASRQSAEDKKMYDATVNWDNVYHWVFRPRWNRAGRKFSEEIWSWGDVYKSVSALGGDYSERLSLRIYFKGSPDRLQSIGEAFSASKLIIKDNSVGKGKFV